MQITPPVLAFGHSLGQELQKRGLHYTPHYTLPLMGRYRHELIDEEAGVYRYDHLRVLHSTLMPAVLLEAGSIVNRQEELELATPERRLMVAEAVTAAAENFCASRGERVAERPAHHPIFIVNTAAPKGIRPASLSHHRRIHAAKTWSLLTTPRDAAEVLRLASCRALSIAGMARLPCDLEDRDVQPSTLLKHLNIALHRQNNQRCPNKRGVVVRSRRP